MGCCCHRQLQQDIYFVSAVFLPSLRKFLGDPCCDSGKIVTFLGRAVSRYDFTTKKLSVRAVSQLSDFSRQVGRRNQLMGRRLSDLSQESGASQISSIRPREALPKKRKNALRIKQSLLRVWKPNKSDSRQLRKTTNY